MTLEKNITIEEAIAREIIKMQGGNPDRWVLYFDDDAWEFSYIPLYIARREALGAPIVNALRMSRYEIVETAPDMPMRPLNPSCATNPAASPSPRRRSR